MRRGGRLDEGRAVPGGPQAACGACRHLRATPLLSEIEALAQSTRIPLTTVDQSQPDYGNHARSHGP
jgi:hypothetical protein